MTTDTETNAQVSDSILAAFARAMCPLRPLQVRMPTAEELEAAHALEREAMDDIHQCETDA